MSKNAADRRGLEASMAVKKLLEPAETDIPASNDLASDVAVEKADGLGLVLPSAMRRLT